MMIHVQAALARVSKGTTKMHTAWQQNLISTLRVEKKVYYRAKLGMLASYSALVCMGKGAGNYM